MKYQNIKINLIGDANKNCHRLQAKNLISMNYKSGGN